jgi:hypothetical protein
MLPLSHICGELIEQRRMCGANKRLADDLAAGGCGRAGGSGGSGSSGSKKKARKGAAGGGGGGGCFDSGYQNYYYHDEHGFGGF